MLKGKSEDNIVEYLRPQGVTASNRFKIMKDRNLVETNTLLLTFDRVNVPKSLKIFYRVVPVDVYIPNPLRCLTASGSDIMKTTVLKTPDLYARTVERTGMPITLVNVNILPNA